MWTARRAAWVFAAVVSGKIRELSKCEKLVVLYACKSNEHKNPAMWPWLYNFYGYPTPKRKLS